MQFFKRIGLFLLTNLLIMLVVSVILNIVFGALGIRSGRDSIVGLAIMCGVWGMAGAFISLAISRMVAKWTYGLKPIDPTNCTADEKWLHSLVEGQARKAGLPATPEVAVYEADEPNAFATGPSKSRSLVAFSSGLLNGMSKDEIAAVSGHEISHIANGDMVTMTLLTGVANAMVMFMARIIAQAISMAMRSDDDDGESWASYGVYMLITFVLEIVFMILASIVLAWFSRQREYRADQGGAQLTSRQAMANSLARLHEMVTGESKKTIFDTAKISSNARFSIFASHPPLEERVARLTQNS